MTGASSTDPDGRHGPHVFVDDVDRPLLAEDDHHHLARVLRVGDGDPCTVSDGRGRWAPAAFGPAPRLTGEPVAVDRPRPEITVAVALVKDRRPELVVQKLTEVGVDRIVPLVTERTVVRWKGERADRHLDRLRVVAREAAMQCRRSWLPEVTPVSSLDVFAGRTDVARATPGGAAPDLDHPTMLVGPEGGWSDAECAMPWPDVGLGPHVLRTETAAIVAGALLVARRMGSG